MKITILGCGNAGSAVAADLSLKGHDVIVCKTSTKMHNDHYAAMYDRQGVVLVEDGAEYDCSFKVTNNLKQAIADRELIIVFIQTNYHEQLIARISPFLEDGQIVLLEPGYLSSCYLLKHCDRNIRIVEAESSPIDCRITSPGKVSVLFRNVRNPLGIYPPETACEVMAKLETLRYNFQTLNSVIEAALHNPNLIVHTVGAILSTPRIEYVQANGGSYSMYKEVFTPHVWRLVKQLDKEKMDVLEVIGCMRIPYVEACKYRNSLDESKDAEEVFFDYANNSAPAGPYTSDSRYMTEDVPEGLVLLESLGKAYQVDTPICTSLINIASSFMGIDYRHEGRNLQKLGLEYIKKILE